MKLRGILFDLDDTLIDRKRSMPVYAAHFHERFGSKLADISTEEIAEKIHRADGGGYRRQQDKFNDLLASMPWTEQPTAEEILEHWDSHFSISSVPMEGMFPLLAELRKRGLLLGLITNGFPVRQNGKIDHLGLRDHFDAIFVSGEVGIHKPDPRIYQLALEKLQLQPEQALFIGDHPVNDILGAQAVGLTPVWRRGCHEWPTEHPLPKWQFEQLADLYPILEQLEKADI